MQLATIVKQEGYPNIYGARRQIDSSWKFDNLQHLLHDYHDQEVIEFLKFGWPANRLSNAPMPTVNQCNHASVTSNEKFVKSYLRKELAAGHLVGPFPYLPFKDHVAVSSLSTRPKRDSLERRTIVDLSYPAGASVNDFTSKTDYLGHAIELYYPTVNDLAKRIHELGYRCKLYKKDMLSAFKQVGLDPADIELFGIMWDKMVFFYRVLVMGHRITPYIMQRVSSLIMYLHNQLGYFLLNYIDDYIGAETAEVAQTAYEALGRIMQDIGAAEATEKAVPPSTRVEFLGVMFDTVKGTMEVTPERLHQIVMETETLYIKESVTRKDLERIVGKLQFVAACVRPGRVFISRLLNKIRSIHDDKEHNMDSQTRKDLFWWKTFLTIYNGVSIMWPVQYPVPDEILVTDACPHGAGGILWGDSYFRFNFPPEWTGKNIAYLEMLALIVVLKVWGWKLKGCKIVAQCDNESCAGGELGQVQGPVPAGCIEGGGVPAGSA